MSEMYEGIVVRGDEQTVREAFDNLRSPLTFRLVYISDSVFGVYRVANRGDGFDPEGMLAAASQFARRLGQALMVAFDNGSGVRISALVNENGLREFGEEDELWAPLDMEGKPVANSNLRTHELDPEGEYECVRSALDLGLDALGIRASVSPAALTNAFCYEGHSLDGNRG